jgi:ATPase subunit of ABC transporter with duplicated ATPase domains
MIDISVKNIAKRYFSDPVFTNVSFDVKSGEKIALIGENGTGKTTILKILLGIENVSSGEVFIRRNIRTGYLSQIPNSYEGLSAFEVLTLAFSELEEIKNRLRELEILIINDKRKDHESLLLEYGNLQTNFENKGGYEIDEKISRISNGLKLTQNLLNNKFDSLSGGEKTRLELGKILLEEPEIILLDEPTNHLDIESSIWLEGFLKEFKGSCLIISHDRYFLDKVIDHIFELKSGEIDIYLGNYSYYLQERQIRYELALEKFNQQERKLDQLEQAAKRYRDWGQRADNEALFKKAKAIEKRMEKLDVLDKPFKDSRSIEVKFEFEKRSGNIVLRFKDFNLRIENRALVNCINETVFYKDKIALIGNNGTGKSTLIKRILNELDNEDSEIYIGSNLKVGYLEQNIKFDDEKISILEYVKEALIIDEKNARNYLAKFKFYKEDVFKKIQNLSGGEKIRLRLSVLMKDEINLLLLDEPTNHIDIRTKEVLEESLCDFPGTILFISHDRYFINKLATRVFEIKDNELFAYEGNFDDYSEIIKKQFSEVKPLGNNLKIKENQIKVEQIRDKKVNPYRLKELEEKINSLERELEKIAFDMEIESTNYEKLTLLSKEKDIKEDLLFNLLIDLDEINN